MLILHSNSYKVTLSRTFFFILCVIAVSICVPVTDAVANADVNFRAEAYFLPKADNGYVRLAKRHAPDDIDGNTLEHPSSHSNTLEHPPSHGNTLGHPSSHGNTLEHPSSHDNMIEHPPSHGNTLEHLPSHGNTLEHPSSNGNTLEHPSSNGNTLEHPSSHGSATSKEDLHGKFSHALTSPGILHDDDDVIGDDDRDEVGFDYDFALNLDKDADFDRLLSLLGRSGPAKHEGGSNKPGETSTFIDRHDELIHAHPDFDEEFPDAFLANPQKSVKKFDADDVQSAMDHSGEDNKVDEQNRLEELYFKELERKQGSYEENDRLRRKKRLHNSAPVKASSPVIIFLAVSFLIC